MKRENKFQILFIVLMLALNVTSGKFKVNALSIM